MVEPSVDFGSLELVLVIANFDPDEVLPDFDLLPAAVLTDTAAITGTVTVTATTAPIIAPTVAPAGEAP